ncbi:hypothetical protein ACFX16_027750 [Malus domestica]
MVEVKIEEPLKGKAFAIEEEKTITPKEGLLTYFNIKEALLLPKEMQKALVVVITSPDNHDVQVSKDEGLKLRHMNMPHVVPPMTQSTSLTKTCC